MLSLESTPWRELQHAYGNASYIPALLGQLRHRLRATPSPGSLYGVRSRIKEMSTRPPSRLSRTSSTRLKRRQRRSTTRTSRSRHGSRFAARRVNWKFLVTYEQPISSRWTGCRCFSPPQLLAHARVACLYADLPQ